MKTSTTIFTALFSFSKVLREQEYTHDKAQKKVKGDLEKKKALGDMDVRTWAVLIATYKKFSLMDKAPVEEYQAHAEETSGPYELRYPYLQGSKCIREHKSEIVPCSKADNCDLELLREIPARVAD